MRWCGKSIVKRVAAEDLGAEKPLRLVVGEKAAFLLRQSDNRFVDFQSTDGQRFDTSEVRLRFAAEPAANCL